MNKKLRAYTQGQKSSGRFSRTLHSLVRLLHRHKWKISGYGMYGVTAMVNDCDNVPLSCKCGATALGKWRREEGMIEVKPNDKMRRGETNVNEVKE